MSRAPKLTVTGRLYGSRSNCDKSCSSCRDWAKRNGGRCHDYMCGKCHPFPREDGEAE